MSNDPDSQTTRDLAKALCSVIADLNDHPKDKQSRAAYWQENRAGSTRQARRLQRKLEKRGYEIRKKG